jgi:hypothetical protein
MWFGSVIVVEAVLILALLWVNIAGQPAETRAQLAQISTQATRISVLSDAIPTPTPHCPVSHC